MLSHVHHVHHQANELELMALTPLARYLADLFSTPNELPYVTSAKEWARLSSEECWIHGIGVVKLMYSMFFAKCGWWLPRTTVATLVGHNGQKLSCQ